MLGDGMLREPGNLLLPAEEWGRGGHADRPQYGREALGPASALVMDIQTIVPCRLPATAEILAALASAWDCRAGTVSAA